MALTVEPLATLPELEARLEFELDDEKLIALAESSLVDATILVKQYGDSSWTQDTAPPVAVMLTLKAAVRNVNNPMALSTARGADETNMWEESNASGVYLRPDEIALLEEHSGRDRGFQAPVTFSQSSARRRHFPPHIARYMTVYSGQSAYHPASVDEGRGSHFTAAAYGVRSDDAFPYWYQDYGYGDWPESGS